MISSRTWALLLPVILALRADAAGWRPGMVPLKTRWADRVNPDAPWPEYPRPQMVRTDWLNLNGLWDYAIRPKTSNAPDAWDGKILVPFPVESSLSGVTKALDPDSVLFYHRKLPIPASWKGRRVLIHFGGVDWQCRVVINGSEVGRHQGGYERFSFDITDRLTWTNDEEIVVAVTDPTEGDQPRGKQSLKPEGIFYTASSGLWQTVWLEPVPETCIDSLAMTPDLDADRLLLRVQAHDLAGNLKIEAVAFDGTNVMGTVQGKLNDELKLPLKKVKPWSPSEPFLYDLTVTLKQGNREVDQVKSYFGMRKISLMKDRTGVVRIALNNKIDFEMGALDQGFWPDGLYTAPTDEALRADIEFLKSAGFNLARKHVKIEPDRWYYWCDKLGFLVWQDMPSANNATTEGQDEFEAEMLHMVKDLYNHPSIVLWVLFNEGWGQYNAQRLTQRLKSLDPSRLVDDASGWADNHMGDVADSHFYPGPSAPEPGGNRATVLGEFGGLGLVMPSNSWAAPHSWGYKMQTNQEALSNSYAGLLREVGSIKALHGLSAAVYTQVTDVETECNGLLTYDRALSKMTPSFLARANREASESQPPNVILDDALTGSPEWRFTVKTPDADWTKAEFDDSSWRRGQAGFGSPETPGANVATLWITDDIWLRRWFILSEPLPAGTRLEIHHDEDAEVYLNGVLAARLSSFITHYDLFDITPESAAALKIGTNTIAVHCHQTTGGQYIDVGLVAPKNRESEAPLKP